MLKFCAYMIAIAIVTGILYNCGFITNNIDNVVNSTIAVIALYKVCKQED